MAKNISDQNGRALEYCIVENLKINNTNIILSTNAQIDQKRDKVKFDELNLELKKRFETCANKMNIWLQENFNLTNYKLVEIDRLSDNEAKKGDVTDIRIKYDSDVINLSIKNNHIALKHQRPAATPQQIGFEKKSNEDVEFRLEINKIGLEFLDFVKTIKHDALLFSEIKELDENSIDQKLYGPICLHITNFLNTYCKSGSYAQNYFTFLVGKINFYKIVLFSNNLEISNFSDIEPVTSLNAKNPKPSYVEIKFSNNWIIEMRLHTASSKIKGLSLKFDTQPVEINVEKEIIDLY